MEGGRSIGARKLFSVSLLLGSSVSVLFTIGPEIKESCLGNTRCCSGFWVFEN